MQCSAVSTTEEGPMTSNHSRPIAIAAALAGALISSNAAWADDSRAPGTDALCATCGVVVRVQRHNPDPAAAAMRIVDHSSATGEMMTILPTQLEQGSGVPAAFGADADGRFEVHVQFDDGRREIRLVSEPDAYRLGQPVPQSARYLAAHRQ